MSSHLTDKSLLLAEGHTGVRLAARRAFATAETPARFPPDRTVRVTQLTVSLTLDPATPGFTATARLALALHPGASGQARLDLGAVTVTAVEDETGAPLAWSHHEDTLHVDALGDSGAATIVVHYTGDPPRGLYRTGPTAAEPDRPPMAWTQCQDVDGHHLFPCIDHPSHKQPITLHATVPTGLEVVGNGALVEKTEVRPGWTRWTWTETRPIPAYLFTMVVGPMVVVADETVAGAGPGGADVPVRYLAPAGTDPALLRPNLGKTPAMIAFCVERLGVPYPYPRYDQVIVHDFIFGGMENAGATTLTDVALLPPAARLDGDMDDLVIHELAHQWFGDLVTCEDWSQAWLNEGWATYMQYVWAAPDKGEDDALYDLLSTMDNYMGEYSGRYRRALVEGRYDAPIDLFDRHLYEKGGLVLHTLRGQLGETAFWGGVRDYLQTHSDGGAHTRDFQRALEASSGRSLERFFSEWVTGVGHPELKLQLSWAGGTLTVHASQTQSGDRVAAAFALSLPLFIEHADGTVEEQSLSLGRRSQALALSVAARPRRVGVDPRLTALAALTIEAPDDWLVASLARDEAVVGRIRAARALAKKRGPTVVPALVACLEGDDHWSVRAAAADALARIGGPRAVAALVAATAVDCPRTRAQVVAALGRCRAPAAREALAALDAAAEVSLRVRAEWAAALGRSRHPSAVARLAPLVTTDSWSSLLARKALEGLGQTADPAAWAPISAAAAADQLGRVRAAAASAAGSLAGLCPPLRPAARELLLDLLADGGFRVRLAAISALGSLGDNGARGALAAVAQSDPDARTRATATAALRTLDAAGSGASVDGIRDELRRLHDRNDALIDRLARIESP